MPRLPTAELRAERDRIFQELRRQGFTLRVIAAASGYSVRQVWLAVKDVPRGVFDAEAARRRTGIAD